MTSDKSNKKIKIETLKGRPLLHWVNKHPLEYVTGFPTQLTEIFDPQKQDKFLEIPKYAELEKNWHNLLFHGDNKEVLATLLELDFRGKVDLIYIDPPFASNKDYVRKVELRGLKNLGRIEEDSESLIQQTMYEDIWKRDEYFQFMYERLILLKELLAETGSIYVHLDYRMVHYIKVLMDEVFGQDNLRNEIIWRCGRMGAAHESLPTAHNTILLYTKTNDWKWEHPRMPYAQSLIKSLKKDEKGYYYTRGRMGREMAEWERKQGSGLKTYVDIEQGKQADDVWDDVGSYTAGEYATQKPPKLLERIVNTSSKPNDLVMDCFMGSGVAMVAAQK